MRKSLTSIFAVAFFIFLFISSLAIAGGGAGAANSTPSSSATVVSGGGSGGGGSGGVPIPPTTGPRLSQLLTEKLLSEASSVAVNLVGPEIYWTDTDVVDSQATISIDSGLVKQGRYMIYVTFFDNDGYSNLTGSGEAPLFGKNVVVNIPLLPPNGLNMKIYLPNYQPGDSVEWRQTDQSGGSSWGPREVKQNDNGYYLKEWVRAGSVITITTGNSKFSLDAESLFGDYVNNGYVTASNEEVFSNAKVNISIYDGPVYPYDYPDNMSLTQAIASLANGEVLTLVEDYYPPFIAKTGVTIRGPAGRPARIYNNGPSNYGVEVVKNPDSDEPLVLKNLLISTFNSQKSGLHKTDYAKVAIDHIVFDNWDGSSAISGEPAGLTVNHCTFVGQGTGIPLNFYWPQGWDWDWTKTVVKNSVFVNYGQIMNPPLTIKAENNLIWNIADVRYADLWIRTTTKDPQFLNMYPEFTPDISSPAVAAADDGSYLGAIMPRKWNY